MSQPLGSVSAGVGGSGGVSVNAVKATRNFKIGDRTSRMWSPREEEILSATLVELVALGWKSDNGIRSGYLQICEDSILQEFPTSDIKGNPHVVSKITSWKTSYTSLRNILDRTGVGFNSNGDYKIEIDHEQWEHVVQVEAKAKFMRNKSWPFWETWKCIFGKDRATGAGSESIPDTAGSLCDGFGVDSHCDKIDSQPLFGTTPLTDVDEADHDPITDPNNSRMIEKPASTAKTTGEKRKAVHSDVMLMDFLANLHAETNTRLEVISSRIGYDFDLGHTRQAVFDKRLFPINALFFSFNNSKFSSNPRIDIKFQVRKVPTSVRLLSLDGN